MVSAYRPANVDSDDFIRFTECRIFGELPRTFAPVTLVVSDRLPAHFSGSPTSLLPTFGLLSSLPLVVDLVTFLMGIRLLAWLFPHGALPFFTVGFPFSCPPLHAVACGAGGDRLGLRPACQFSPLRASSLLCLTR
jgi:hypothetical protein